MKLRDRTAIVTGASTGIGRETPRLWGHSKEVLIEAKAWLVSNRKWAKKSEKR